ncbi:MAG: hypothetical protein U9P73_05925 [Candidatus Cloacimonadota bacterium]|nr:hypothetical protein [Candidatus Cloacimonadota bacterium]
MNNKIISFWRIAVISVVAYILIYLFPGYLFLYIQENVVSKELDMFNQDADLVEQVILDSLNSKSEYQCYYDVEKIENLYNKLEVKISSKRIEKLEQPYNNLWQGAIFGELLSPLIIRLQKNVLKAYHWNLILFYNVFLLLMTVLTFFFYRKQILYVTEGNWIQRIKQQNRKVKIIISIGLTISSFILLYILYLSNGLEDIFSFKIDSKLDIGTELKNVVHYLFVLFYFYVIYLFSYINNNLKSKYSIKNIFALFWSLLLSGVLVTYLITIYKISQSASVTYLSNLLISYVGLERYFTYFIILITMIISLSIIFYIIYRLVFAPRQMNRLAYIVKVYFIILILNWVLDLFELKVNQFSEIIITQNNNATQSEVTQLSSIIMANTYQWFHIQKDNHKITDNLPGELTLSVEDIENVTFSKIWDNKKLVLEFIIDFPEKKISRLVISELDVETGEDIITIY